ncbi:hypothetical protein [Nocardioides sp. T2.26MG-1]|uniref:hypothetical protein n=1 Tax=Nocardioides sp. T2.26MG-1 TaxID=3041166 RepID=UPI0024774323|nr:hypothetical protein [Nocardioides sp. T2.26MG-1]CAI9404036.1 hypothetical protein HIDPHFAB_04099 [Nocardioides sp. T2.26MG-1]
MSNSGKVLRAHNVAVFLHDHDRALGGGKTNRLGAYDITICRSSALATAAKRHTGRVNLDVVVHRGTEDKPWYVRIGSGRYARPVIAISKRFVAAKTTDETVDARPAAKGGGTIATGVAATETSTLYPELMFVQVVPHMVANYTLSSSNIGTFKAVIGVESGVFKSAGELAIEGSGTFESDKQLLSTKKHPKRALLIHPVLAATSQYTCYKTNPYFPHLRTSKCVTESSGHWTGDVRKEATRFRGCGSGKADPIRFTNHDQKGLKTSDGVKYSSSVSAGALGTSMTVSATYGGATRVDLEFDQERRVNRFCSGGNGEAVSSSSAFYVDYLPRAEPCQPHTPCRD